MSLKDVYQRFLGDAKTVSLASDISLVYVPSTTRIDKPDAILNHFVKQSKIVKKTSEQVLDTIEGPDSLCLDVETTVEFVSGGGAYLPSMDDAFLADQVATFPMIHIVRFNDQNQIQQIRLYWDQASLLKQVQVIGLRGRAWPIRDGKDQTRVIKSAISAVGESSAPAPSQPSSKEDNNSGPANVTSPGRRVVKDPYAAESLTDILSPPPEQKQQPRRPRTQRPERDLSELFVGDEGDSPEQSPSRRPFKFNPARYSHFEIGGDNSAREVKPAPSRPSHRHQAQWDFVDFVTPEKPKRPLRKHEIRHFGWSDDEPEPTPPPKPRVVHPRRDAESHIVLADPSEEDRPARRLIGSFQNRGLSLYRNPLFPDDDSPAPAGDENKAPSTTKNPPRMKDLDPHWSLSNLTPQKGNANNENGKPATTHLKAVQMMEPNWQAYDVSPEPKKTAPPLSKGAQNTMRKNWSLGDESD